MPYVFNPFDTYVDTSSVTSHVPSVNPSRSQSEKQVGDLQEEMRKTLEQVKALENIIASGDIKLDEAAQLWELYIIIFKRDICTLKTNLNNISEENKANVDLKQKPKDMISYNKSRIKQ